MRAPAWPLASVAIFAAAMACGSGSSGGGPGGSSGSSSGTSGSSSGSSSSSSGAGGTATVSCDYASTNSHYCIEMDNLSSADASQQVTDCKMSSGTVGSGCAKTNLLGSCTAPTRNMYYYCGSVSSYETDCTLYKGTWTPGSGGQVTC